MNAVSSFSVLSLIQMKQVYNESRCEEDETTVSRSHLAGHENIFPSIVSEPDILDTMLLRFESFLTELYMVSAGVPQGARSLYLLNI